MKHLTWEALIAGPIQSFPYSWLMVHESRHIYVCCMITVNMHTVSLYVSLRVCLQFPALSLSA